MGGKRQKIRVSVDKDPLSLDKRKTRRATLPNFIHNLDSQLLHSVIIKARKRNINLAVIHDSFMVHKKYESQVKKWYFEAFNDLILSKNKSVLLSYLKRNLPDIKNLENEFPEIIEKEFSEILEKREFSEIIKKEEFCTILEKREFYKI